MAKYLAAGVHDYFYVPCDSFWAWREQGEVVAWVDDATIAFRSELDAALRQLVTGGAPPLGAVVLLLAACQPSWHEADPRNLLLERVGQALGISDAEKLAAAVCGGLEVVHQVWRAHRLRPAIKAALATAVFAGRRQAPPAEKADLLPRALEKRPGVEGMRRIIPPQAAPAFLEELNVVRSSLASLDVATLEQRLLTGFDQLVLAAGVELPRGGTIQELLTSLADDVELGGVVRLARQLLGSFSLPRRLGDPDDLPDGGFSEISNRGTLDRLLPSELAHDDLTLAVRVALREALYFQRESPPRTPPQRRLVLLDAGVRLWGIPRVFVTAVGLAAACRSETHGRVAVFRTQGSDIAPVDFSRREGLVAQLAALDDGWQPGPALATLRRVGSQGPDEAEILLVTAEDVLDDPEFQASLTPLAEPALFVATVNRAGRFRLQVRTKRGRRLLSEAQFELERLLAPTPRKPLPLQRGGAPADLPAICREPKFPLLLPVPTPPKRFWHVPHFGFLVLLKDGRLMRYINDRWGAAQLAEELPGGEIRWARTRGSGHRQLQHVAVFGRLSQRGLYALCLDVPDGTPEIRRLQLAQPQPLGVSGHHGTVFVIYRSLCEALDPLTGHLLASAPIPAGVHWLRRGRFFSRTRAGNPTLLALDYDGTQLRWHEMASPFAATDDVTLLDGPHGPIAVSASSAVVDLATDERWSVADATEGVRGRVTNIAPDDSRFIFEVMEPPPLKRTLVHTGIRGSFAFPDSSSGGTPDASAPYGRMWSPCTRNLRFRFEAITVDAQRRLTLVSRGGQHWPLTYAPDDRAIVLPTRGAAAVDLTATIVIAAGMNPVVSGEPLFQPFERQLTLKPDSYRWRIARWRDGSRAVLDSRGLLHLRSSDRAIPEFTIVLSPGETAGWVADGRRWGEPYFVGISPVTLAAEIHDQLLRPFVERLQ